MILLGILVFGLGLGWLANVILGNGSHPQDWGPLLVAGFAGSLVGGLLISLLSGDGLALKPSGILGSIVGAVIVLGVWQAVAARKS